MPVVRGGGNFRAQAALLVSAFFSLSSPEPLLLPSERVALLPGINLPLLGFSSLAIMIARLENPRSGKLIPGRSATLSEGRSKGSGDDNEKNALTSRAACARKFPPPRTTGIAPPDTQRCDHDCTGSLVTVLVH